MTTTTKPQTLPTIIAYTGVRDSGEFGNANCAHCGALGRYEYDFIGDDGRTHSAMAGCIQRFPVSRVAKAHKAILDKQKTGKKLNGWDTKILEAVSEAINGTMTVPAAEAAIATQEASRRQWMAKKFGGRR